MATLFVDKLDPQSGTSLEIGTSGDTVTVPSGATFNVAGTLQSGGNAVANTAEFLAYISSDQTINHNSATKVTFQTESYDPDGVFDNSSNYRFVAPSAGKYMMYTNITVYDASTDIEEFKIFFYKNGSKLTEAAWQKNSGNRLMKANLTTTLVLNLASSDYIEVYVYNNQVDSGSTVIEAQSSIIQNYFGGYKLIT